MIQITDRYELRTLYRSTESRLRAGESVGEIAEDIGGDVVDASDVDWGGVTLDVDGDYLDCLVLPGWVADDGNAEVYYPHAESGAEAAQEYIDGGDWGDPESTEWVTVHTWQVVVALSASGEYVTGTFGRESHMVAVEPEEPECPEGEHEWASDHSVVGGCESNPGVFGSGGGVVITEHCRHCGTYREIDTWAQDPQTGTQGLRSVRYRDADAASRRATYLREEVAS